MGLPKTEAKKKTECKNSCGRAVMQWSASAGSQEMKQGFCFNTEADAPTNNI
jgi:hypothetical protein